MESKHYDSIIIGAGPAGLTAGIYLSRAKAKVLILDSGVAGGQMILTHEIANYPGFEHISGYELSNNMRLQAKRFGCDIMSGISITEIDFESSLKSLKLSGGKQIHSRHDHTCNRWTLTQFGCTGRRHFQGKRNILLRHLRRRLFYGLKKLL